jgi:hypothetical protein
MKESVPLSRQSRIAVLVLVLLLPAVVLQNPRAQARTVIGPALVSYPTTNGMTGEMVFTKLLEHNRLREARLQEYSVTRTYKIKSPKGTVRAEIQVLMQYRAPGAKEFKVLSQSGSGIIRGRVFKPLMDSEVETAAGRSRYDSSISPANYKLGVVGEEDLDGHHCIVVEATPTRDDKYLFKGKVWIHATEFAVVKIEGQPARSPSWWIKQVDFVRRYQKIGQFWLPFEDESISQIRVFGRYTLTISHYGYEIRK